MSDDSSLLKYVAGTVTTITIAVVGWHNRRLDKLTDKVDTCQATHVKNEDFNKKADKLEESIESLRREIKSDFNRLYDKMDEKR